MLNYCKQNGFNVYAKAYDDLCQFQETPQVSLKLDNAFLQKILIAPWLVPMHDSAQFEPCALEK